MMLMGACADWPVCLQAFFILGEWLLALLAWLLPEWRHLSLAAAGQD
jgi:hypothetical protein